MAADAIARDGLRLQLDAGLVHPVVLVTAPAGFGKTWLVADWLDGHSEVAQAWVSVDRYDNDPMRLWRHILEAVAQSEFSKAAAEALRLFDKTGAGLPVVVDALAAGLAGVGGEFILVLDDTHVLDSAEATASLGQLLGLLPESTHVVLIGRHDPGLPLAKWRLAGDLVEIRTSDLRCSLEESQAVVSGSLGLELDDELVAELQHKTMGWIAGIRLAATAAAAANDAGRVAASLPGVGTMLGAYEAVGDYLIEEALDNLTAADRAFLLDTSILSDLTGPLCAVVSERDDAAAVLDRLARAGMFTNRSGTDGDWYRYHELFRDALRVMLHRATPKREAELHRRAAMWLHDAGDTVAAVRHAIAAGDTDLAGRWLIDYSTPMLIAKQSETMCTLFRELDATGDPLSATALAAWCFPALFSNAPGTEIDDVLDRAHTAITTMTPADHTNLADQWAQVPYAFRENPVEMLGGIDATIAHRHGDTNLATTALAAQGDQPSESGWIEGAAGEMLIYLGRLTEGARLLEPWMDYSFSPLNPILGNQAHALAFQAFLKIGEGRLAEAEVLADRGVEVMRTNGLADQPQAAVATVPLAWVSYERGDLDTAHTLIKSVLERLEHYGEVPAYVFAHTLLARIHHARGDRSSAAATLETARLSPTGRPITGHFADLVAYERARLALLNGNLPGAENALPDWPTRIKTGATTMTEHLTLTRLAIATGDDPTPLFDAPPDGVDVTPAHQIELHKLRALAALRHGDEDAALEHLTEAMTTATHTGHRQTFLDDYPTLGILLDNAAAMTGHRLNPIPSTATTTIDPAAMSQLTEPLTERELEVLRLLPSHLTYREIAEQLYVSTNTVKSYNKNIYRKLNADTRNQAVTNATALGLVP